MPLESVHTAIISVLFRIMAIIIFIALIPLASYVYLYVKKQQNRVRLLDKQSSIESIRALHWQQFEHLLGETFRRQGYQVEQRGGAQADGGIDLLLWKDGNRYCVQCKHWRAQQVGVAVVRELYGVMASEQIPCGIIVTSGRITEAANDFARGKWLELIDGEALLPMIQAVQSVSTRYIHQLQEEKARTVPPHCPLCGQVMILRTAKKGVQAGSQFWGCPTYPQCHGTRAITISNQ